MTEKFNRFLMVVVSLLILSFVLAPILVLVISSFNSSRYFEFPPTGFTLEWYQRFAQSKEYQQSLLISTRVALTAAGLGLLAGVPAAFALDRYKFHGNAFLQSVFLSPLLLPQIIWAIGLVQLFSMVRIGERNVLGTFYGIVLAHTVIILPYVIRMVLTSLKYVEEDLENAAMSLGAPPIRTFFEVTVPIILPGVIVGAIFGFLWFNVHPAQMFMGDTGSLSLGATLGVVALMTGQWILLPVICVIPVSEAMSDVIQVTYFKLSKGKRVFRMAPLHHHFELLGWSETQVVQRFWLIGLMFAMFGVAIALI